MNILGITGSPRMCGSTSLLLDKIAEGLSLHKSTYHKINLHELKLEYCTGCKSCEQTRTCVINDRFTELYDLFCASDIIIIGSPSYWGDITGQLKVMFDRFTPYCDTIDGTTTIPSGKIGISVAVRAGKTKAENEHIINSIEHFYGHLDIKPAGSISVENVTTTDDLFANPLHLQNAYMTGTKVASLFATG